MGFSLAGKAGFTVWRFQGITERREGQAQGRQAVELFLSFEKETIVMRSVFDKDGRVGGLVFRPKDMAVLPANK